MSSTQEKVKKAMGTETGPVRCPEELRDDKLGDRYNPVPVEVPDLVQQEQKGTTETHARAIFRRPPPAPRAPRPSGPKPEKAIKHKGKKYEPGDPAYAGILALQAERRSAYKTEVLSWTLVGTAIAIALAAGPLTVVLSFGIPGLILLAKASPVAAYVIRFVFGRVVWDGLKATIGQVPGIKQIMAGAEVVQEAVNTYVISWIDYALTRIPGINRAYSYVKQQQREWDDWWDGKPKAAAEQPKTA